MASRGVILFIFNNMKINQRTENIRTYNLAINLMLIQYAQVQNCIQIWSDSLLNKS